MVYFVFDIANLAIVIAGCFLGGFLPLMIMIAKCPEAKEFIKCMVDGGGIMIDKINAAGQREYVCAKPLGTEGQYIAGRNEFGQREIFIRPQTVDNVFGKANMLAGIRRPIFSAFSGKTVMVPGSVLAAIATAELSSEEKDKLPSNIKRWMDDNKVTVEEMKEMVTTVKVAPTEENPSGSVEVKTKQSKSVSIKILELDATKIANYFKSWFNQSQFDVLLQKSEQTGYLRGLGVRAAGAGGSKKWLLVGIMVFVIITIVGIVGFMVMGGGGK